MRTHGSSSWITSAPAYEIERFLVDGGGHVHGQRLRGLAVLILRLLTHGEGSRPTENAVQGRPVTLMIRPEHMRLSRKPIEERRNARTTIETNVNYGDNALVIGQVVALSMRVRVLGADVVILKEGDECSVSWMPESVYLIAQ